MPYSYEPPPGPQTPADNGEVMIFMKDGSVNMVRDYWVADGQLHYRTADGGENTLNWNDIDVQQTVDANAKRGVNFTLRPSDAALEHLMKKMIRR